jgi:hypothetical protein
MNIKRCGTCFFAKISPQIVAHDLTKRVCYGAPPSAVQMQVQGGGMTLQMTRPIVGVSEEACSVHREKDVQDVARDADNIHAMKTMQSASETKQ